MTAPVINWQELPPPLRRGGTDEANAIAAVLRENPGRWAKMETIKYNSRPKKYLDRGLECLTRTNPNGGWDVYVRAPQE